MGGKKTNLIQIMTQVLVYTDPDPNEGLDIHLMLATVQLGSAFIGDTLLCGSTVYFLKASFPLEIASFFAHYIPETLSDYPSQNIQSAE